MILMGGKKKKEEEGGREIDIPPLPDDMPDPGASQKPSVVDEGITRNHAGVFPWRILVVEEGFLARLYPQGFRGPYENLYTEATSSKAKEKILLWIENKGRQAQGLPPKLLLTGIKI